MPASKRVSLEIDIEHVLLEYRVTVESSANWNETVGVSEVPGDVLEMVKLENGVTTMLNAMVAVVFPSVTSIVISLNAPLVVMGQEIDPVDDETVNPAGQFCEQR